MNPCPEELFLLELRDSRVDCRPRDVCFVSDELQISRTVLSHRGDDLDVFLVQERDESIDPLQVFLGRDLAQIGFEEKVGPSELFNVLPTLG